MIDGKAPSRWIGRIVSPSMMSPIGKPFFGTAALKHPTDFIQCSTVQVGDIKLIHGLHLFFRIEAAEYQHDVLIIPHPANTVVVSAILLYVISDPHLLPDNHHPLEEMAPDPSPGFSDPAGPLPYPILFSW